MDIWISMPNSQMANNLVKWWKTKFLNGYKQFSAECSDGKVSDTEELLGQLGSEDDANERLRAACTTPPLQTFHEDATTTATEPPTPAPPPPPSPAVDVNNTTTGKKLPQDHLSFEEFSCDVSVENGADHKSGQERQEFSFTLYDFDGHGKITKDDIAGLVTTIYEALGSSVKVPHYGSKTIKVKLTVSPDQRKHVSATIINQKDESDDNDNNKQRRMDEDDEENTTNIRYKKDLNVTIKQRNVSTKRRTNNKHNNKKSSKKHHHQQQSHYHHHQCCNRHHHQEDNQEEEDNNPFVSDDSSDACSRISGNLSSDDEEADGCFENELIKPKKHHHHSNNNNNDRKCYKNSSRYTIPNLFLKDSNITCNDNNCDNTNAMMKSLKKRSGSLQRQELLEIIQANMDKNNLGFQTPRKHSNSNHVSSESTTKPSAVEHKHHHNHKSQHKLTNSSSPLQYLANIVDPTHFYVDLASLQNTTQLPQTNCQYNKLIDAVMCVSNKKISLNKSSTKCRKHKTKNNNNYNNNNTTNNNNNNNNNSNVNNECNEMPFRYQFIHYPMLNDENKLLMNKSNKRTTPKKSCENNATTNKNNSGVNTGENVTNVKNTNKLTTNTSASGSPHIVTGHTSSPHHLRHKNRQEDQARAMAQVVRWLEQEFSSNFHAKEKVKNHNHHHHHHKEKSANENVGGSTPPPSSPGSSGVERHEHHHVHEHIHHHYHHYKEMPMVV